MAREIIQSASITLVGTFITDWIIMVDSYMVPTRISHMKE